MDLHELIDAGSKKAGEQKALASLIGVSEKNISDAKAHRRGLPAAACFLLADYLGINADRVIAASELVTEKNEEKRKVFYPFVMGRAVMILVSSALIGTTAHIPESHAAQGFLTSEPYLIGIMSTM